jgi:hypothetical protein
VQQGQDGSSSDAHAFFICGQHMHVACQQFGGSAPCSRRTTLDALSCSLVCSVSLQPALLLPNGTQLTSPSFGATHCLFV